MIDNALKLLKEMTEHSHKAYIVGGFVRDYLLGIESSDIDICTDATPKEIKEIFGSSCLPNEDYGSVIVENNGIRFEITTFRKEIGYEDNRHPIEIKYIEDLYEDLLRRDFVINTICMDENGHIIDYFGGQEDLKNKVIKSMGDSDSKFREDSLRILRAIRFSTVLGFSLDDSIRSSIRNNKDLLRNLSYTRKKEELDKIFASRNYKDGIKLILELGIEKELDIPNVNKILNYDSIGLICMWSILDVSDIYPFTKNELDLIKKVNEAMYLDNLDLMVLYRYGLYVNSIVAEAKGIDIKDITERYNNLIIKCIDDIDIDSVTIMNILDREPGKYIKDIYNDIEEKIIYNEVKNKKDDICRYILSNYR